MSLDKAALLAPVDLDEDDVAIPRLGGSVRVRGLSRLDAAKLANVSGIDREAHILAMGLVDPAMSVSEVKQWMAGAPAGEFNPVAERIGELSGLLESSEKDAYKSDGGGTIL